MEQEFEPQVSPGPSPAEQAEIMGADPRRQDEVTDQDRQRPGVEGHIEEEHGDRSSGGLDCSSPSESAVEQLRRVSSKPYLRKSDCSTASKLGSKAGLATARCKTLASLNKAPAKEERPKPDAKGNCQTQNNSLRASMTTTTFQHASKVVPAT